MENPIGQLTWDEFKHQPVRDQMAFYGQGRDLFHVISPAQFDRALLERLCETATRIRRIGKTKGGLRFLHDLLSEKRAMLYFTQPSTRTFLSFYAAGQLVGLRMAEVRDPTTSSEIKGESPEDSVRTFSSYFDLIIMRHPVGGFAERIAWLLSHTERPVPVFNAGSGKDQHPTQALLDIYTLARSFENQGGIEGKKIAFVGDLARGRTVRSLASLLCLYPGVEQVFVAPPALQIGADILARLDEAGIPYACTDDFESVIGEVDAIYMTRIQDEWDQHEESRSINTEAFHFRAEHLARLRPEAVLMHPLPRRKEIDPTVDQDPRAVYWRQVRNGMWVRAALMLETFDRVSEVNRYYQDLIR